MNVASTTMKPISSSRETSERFGDRKWSFLAILVLALVLRVSAAFVWQGKAEGEGTLFASEIVTVTGRWPNTWLGERAMNTAEAKPRSFARLATLAFLLCLLASLLQTSRVFRSPGWLRAWRVGGRVGDVVGFPLGWIVGARHGWSFGLWLSRRDRHVRLHLERSSFLPLVLISLACATVAQQRESSQSANGKIYWKGWIGCGMASGMACLCRPSWILFPFCFLVLSVALPGHGGNLWRGRCCSWFRRVW